MNALDREILLICYSDEEVTRHCVKAHMDQDGDFDLSIHKIGLHLNKLHTMGYLDKELADLDFQEGEDYPHGRSRRFVYSVNSAGKDVLRDQGHYIL